MNVPNDYPLEELAESAEKLVEAGGVFFMKWTCGKCGERVTSITPNTLTTYSHHDEPYCGFTTHTAKTGANYVAVYSTEGPKSVKDLMVKVAAQKDRDDKQKEN